MIFVEMMRESHLPRTVLVSVASVCTISEKKPFESFLIRLRSRDERDFILELTCTLYKRRIEVQKCAFQFLSDVQPPSKIRHHGKN
jgi:hypothetical protein